MKKTFLGALALATITGFLCAPLVAIGAPININTKCFDQAAANPVQNTSVHRRNPGANDSSYFKVGQVYQDYVVNMAAAYKIRDGSSDTVHGTGAQFASCIFARHAPSNGHLTALPGMYV
jgi:hypothetical protein